MNPRPKKEVSSVQLLSIRLISRSHFSDSAVSTINQFIELVTIISDKELNLSHINTIGLFSYQYHLQYT